MDRGNLPIQFYNDGDKEDSVRFDWIKRFPLDSFSYNEFMGVSRALIDLTREYQGIKPLVKILSYNSPQDCLTVHSLSGGQDEETAHALLNGRNAYTLETFAKEDYERNIEPELFLKSEGSDSFMICLAASAGCRKTPFVFNVGQAYPVSFISKNPKKRLEFYGQCLRPELFEEFVRKYHNPSLSHTLDHPYVENPLSWALCKVLPC